MRIFKFVTREENGYPVLTMDGKEIPLPWFPYEDKGRYGYRSNNSSLRRDLFFHACGLACGILKPKVERGELAKIISGNPIDQGTTMTEEELLSELTLKKMTREY